jgi:hypothetical protein
MPILDVDKARTCLFVKRSLGSGYAGIDNTLFYKDGHDDAARRCQEDDRRNRQGDRTRLSFKREADMERPGTSVRAFLALWMLIARSVGD